MIYLLLNDDFIIQHAIQKTEARFFVKLTFISIVRKWTFKGEG